MPPVQFHGDPVDTGRYFFSLLEIETAASHGAAIFAQRRSILDVRLTIEGPRIS
jgi:hypothetical protein